MNIILSSYGCHPNRGSESGVGWNWLFELSKYNKVWVIFYKGQGQYEAVSKAVDILPQKENIHLVPLDVSFLFRIKKLFRLRYEIWQIKAYFNAKKIIRLNKIDLIHQVTIASWWFTGYYYLLKKPIVWGPISGGQSIPKQLYSFLRKRDIFYEILRKIIVFIFLRISFSLKQNIKKSRLIFVANEATELQIKRLFKSTNCIRMIEIGAKCICMNKLKYFEENRLKILWSGLLIPRKNFGLLLKSLEKLPHEMNWELKVAGGGRMLNYLKERTLKTKINSKITFLDNISYSKMTELYEWADIFVFPSLREASGTVILEAMSHGVPVIALDLNGAKNIIDPSCGILIDTTNSQQIIDDFSKAIIKLYENPQLRLDMGNKARKKVEENFLWEIRGKIMQKYYETIKRNNLIV